MISEQEVLNEIKAIRQKTELLANPLFSDAGGSRFWSCIDNKLENIEHTLEKEIEHLSKYVPQLFKATLKKEFNPV